MYISRFDVYAHTVVSTSFIDCDVLDKTNNLTLHVYNDAVITIKSYTQSTRSRYSKYVYYNYRHNKSNVKRDREPSRIPTRTLKHLNI